MELHKKIEIVVYDPKRNIIPYAKVTLKPLEKTRNGQ